MTPDEESVVLLEQNVMAMEARAAQATGPEELALCAHVYMQQKAALHERYMWQGLNASGPEVWPFVGDEKFWCQTYCPGEGGKLELRESAHRVSPTLWQLRAVRMQRAFSTWSVSELDMDSSTSADTQPELAGRNPFVYELRSSTMTTPSSEGIEQQGSRATSPETVSSFDENLQRRIEESAGEQGNKGGRGRQGSWQAGKTSGRVRHTSEPCIVRVSAHQALAELLFRKPAHQPRGPRRRSVSSRRSDLRIYSGSSSLPRESTATESLSLRSPCSPHRTAASDNPDSSDSPLRSASNRSSLDRVVDLVDIGAALQICSGTGAQSSSVTWKKDPPRNAPLIPQNLRQRFDKLSLEVARSERDSESTAIDTKSSRKVHRGQRRRARSLDDAETSMPSNTGLARQPPGSTMGTQQQVQMSVQSPAQQQGNGMGPGLTNGLSHAGHQTDINYLWGVVQELSDALSRNREQTAAIVARVQNMNGANDAGISHVAGVEQEQVNGDHPSNLSAENASLRSQLHQCQITLAEAQAEASSLASINDDYVTFLHGAMDKIRTYAYAHSNAMVATHAHYNQLLEQEREANMQLRIEHGEWQRGLGRAAELARNALKERSDEVSGLERKMRETRAENLVLRRLLGWEAVDEDDSEDEDQSELHARQRVAAGAGQGTNLT